MTKNNDIEGQTGFDNSNNQPKELTKDIAMFKLDDKGNIYPEKFEIYVYDKQLDKELHNEAILLMNAIKKQDAIKASNQEALRKYNNELAILKNKLNTTKDNLLKNKIQEEINVLKQTNDIGSTKIFINDNILESSINESRKIIDKLNKIIDEQKKAYTVELCPCTVGESFVCFEKGKTIDGKETDDWVADLISKKCKNPSFTFEEAKKLKEDFKIAIKEKIMEISNYKMKTYRDIITEEDMKLNRPLTLKK